MQPAPGPTTPTQNKNDYDGIRLWLSKVLSPHPNQVWRCFPPSPAAQSSTAYGQDTFTATHRYRPRPRTDHRPAQLRSRSGIGPLELLEKSILAENGEAIPTRGRHVSGGVRPFPVVAWPAEKGFLARHATLLSPDRRSPSRVPYRPLFYMIVRCITL